MDTQWQMTTSQHSAERRRRQCGVMVQCIGAQHSDHRLKAFFTDVLVQRQQVVKSQILPYGVPDRPTANQTWGASERRPQMHMFCYISILLAIQLCLSGEPIPVQFFCNWLPKLSHFSIAFSYRQNQLHQQCHITAYKKSKNTHPVNVIFRHKSMLLLSSQCKSTNNLVTAVGDH